MEFVERVVKCTMWSDLRSRNTCYIGGHSRPIVGVCEECENVAETVLRALRSQDTKCKCVITRLRQSLPTWPSPTLCIIHFCYILQLKSQNLLFLLHSTVKMPKPMVSVTFYS
jgi:hypothetical protein